MNGKLDLEALVFPLDEVSKVFAVKRKTNRKGAFYLASPYGGKFVREILSSLSWTEVSDFVVNLDKSCVTLIWCNGCQADLYIRKMRSGYHIVSRLPHRKIMTNKMLLPETLRVQDVVQHCRCVSHPKLTCNDILPPTFVIKTAMQRLQFLRKLKSECLWICKPASLNRGEGITLVRTETDFRNLFNDENTKGGPKRDWIIQKYITHPLLLDQRKFDLRVYLLIIALDNLNCLAFYHPGYVRVTCRAYDLRSDDLCLHLTNQSIQQTDDNYESNKEDTIWSLNRLNEYVNQKIASDDTDVKHLERDWVLGALQENIKAVLAHLTASVRSKVASTPGCFELYGCDFLVETSGKTWLLEINSNPALGLYNATQSAIIPGVVHEAIGIVVETFEKTFRRQPILPLDFMQNFQVIYNSAERSRLPSLRLASPLSKSLPSLLAFTKSTEHLDNKETSRRQNRKPGVSLRRAKSSLALTTNKSKDSSLKKTAVELGQF